MPQHNYLPQAVFDNIKGYFVCTRCGGRVFNYVDIAQMHTYRHIDDCEHDAHCINCGRQYRRVAIRIRERAK